MSSPPHPYPHLDVLKRTREYLSLITGTANLDTLNAWLATLPETSRKITQNHLGEFTTDFVTVMNKCCEKSDTHTAQQAPLESQVLKEYHESLVALSKHKNYLPLLIFLARYPPVVEYLSNHMWQLEHVSDMWHQSSEHESCVHKSSKNVEVFESFLTSLQDQIECTEKREKNRTTYKPWDFPVIISDFRKDLADVHRVMIGTRPTTKRLIPFRRSTRSISETQFWDAFDTWCISVGKVMSSFVKDAHFSIETLCGAKESISTGDKCHMFKLELKKQQELLSPLIESVLTCHAPTQHVCM